MSLPGKDCLGLWKLFLPVNRKAASRLTFVWGIGEEWGVEKSFFPIPQKLEPWFCTLCACVSLRGLDENDLKFYKNEESTWKACQTTIVHRQICKFVTILLPSLSCIPTLPNFFLSLLCFFKKYTKVHATREAQLYLWCLDQYVLAYLTIIWTFSSSKELLNCIMEKNDLVSYFSELSCLDGSAITLLSDSGACFGMGGGIISDVLGWVEGS